MEKQGVYIVPTQLMATRPARMADDDAYWASLNAPAHMRIKMRKCQDGLLDGAKNIATSTVKIAFGTDLGIFSYRTNGASEFHEMVTNGIAPARALRAATGVAAELLQRDDIGVLAPGRCADIVAMPGNPFREIAVTKKADFVMKGGMVIKQDGIPVP
jgi:tryptophan 2-monooxygenase